MYRAKKSNKKLASDSLCLSWEDVVAINTKLKTQAGDFPT